MSGLRLIISSFILFWVVLFSIHPKLIQSSCNEFYKKDKTLHINSKSVDLEVAKTPAQREKGLSDRVCINPEQGMLFEFNKPGYYAFWMKDMKFPIDIVWINEDKITVDIKANIIPSTYPKTFTSSTPSKYVLELRAGSAQQLNISQGTVLEFNL
jgi:hypothetical protein